MIFYRLFCGMIIIWFMDGYYRRKSRAEQRAAKKTDLIKRTKPALKGGNPLLQQELLRFGSVHRTNIRTSSTIHAFIRVNHVFPVTLADRLHGAFGDTCPTADAIIRNLICQVSHLPPLKTLLFSAEKNRYFFHHIIRVFVQKTLQKPFFIKEKFTIKEGPSDLPDLSLKISKISGFSPLDFPSEIRLK